MPIYTYRCEVCGEVVDVFERLVGPKGHECCGRLATPVIGGVLWRVGPRWAHGNLLEGRKGTPRAVEPGDLGIST